MEKVGKKKKKSFLADFPPSRRRGPPGTARRKERIKDGAGSRL